ncbi:Putative F-box protein PP2-B8 [Glycine soja]|uniref:Putative F-box protein PP2-B8 n=1 Tax=Glycine soja TaxID=3848 RepID=A0A0B2SIG9_GLYSO|nr:Putative F-box protein PP2-B8 [Glycine soja]
MDTITKVLPEECVATIISLTSAKDACQLSPVSPSLKAIADSDAVWANFLPSDCEDIIDQSSTPTLNLLSKKQIYAHLCDYHVLFDNGNMTLSLEKATGKKCIMVLLSITNIIA